MWRQLFPGDRQDFLLQTGRQKEPGPCAQNLYLWLHQWDPTLSFGPKQHPKQACDTQSGALGRAASVSLVQQDQPRGQFQCERDGLGLTGIESRFEQPGDLVVSKCSRLNPTLPGSFSDFPQR